MAAATKGLELAKLIGAEVTAISIMETSSLYWGRGSRMTQVYSYPYMEEDANQAVDQVSKEGEAMGVVVKKIVKSGVPAHEIVEASKDFDLIVMATFGQTGLSHLLMGSVAEKVVRFALCPVLVIRAHKD
jgi:nucleotide-binding universal stress UspA family protein